MSQSKSHIVQCFYKFNQEFQVLTYTTNNQSIIGMLSTLEVVSDPRWFPISRSTNHYTPTFNNLKTKSTYDGLDQVYMAMEKVSQSLM